MEEIAISTFMYLSEVSYDYGLITKRIYSQNIAKLLELCNLDISEFHLPYYKDPESNLKNEYEDIEINDSSNENSGLELKDYIKISDQLYSKKNFLHFISQQSGKYCKWKFNEYDVDDKPAIPHGHGIEKPNYKLDPYRGLIFNIKKGVDKYESKENDAFLKYLWNQNEFRKVATLAIHFHITNLDKHPLYWEHYRGLKHSPYRLPKKRK